MNTETGAAVKVKAELDALGNPEKAAQLSRFFKTDPGEYGEGDRFIGIKVPEQRRVAKRHGNIALVEIDHLLASPIHEHRLTGLLILVAQFTKSHGASYRREIVDFYLSHLGRVNNWDLVDLSAPKILGEHLVRHPEERAMLFAMAKSDNLWERRIAVLATLPMIKQRRFDELMALAEALLTDPHDLIHKAVGWMLREAGKVDPTVLEGVPEKARRGHAPHDATLRRRAASPRPEEMFYGPLKPCPLSGCPIHLAAPYLAYL